MGASLWWLFIMWVVFLFFQALLRGSHCIDDESVCLNAKQTTDRYIDKIKTYFFTKDMFDFEKFCDYIMCIRDDQSINEYAEMLMELDMLIKLSEGLSEKLVLILVYDSRIIEISHKNFFELQKDVREGLYENTMINFVIILLNTLFYLKQKTIRNNK